MARTRMSPDGVKQSVFNKRARSTLVHNSSQKALSALQVAAGGFTKTPRLDLSTLEARQAPPITSRTMNYKIVERSSDLRQVMTPIKAKASIM